MCNVTEKQIFLVISFNKDALTEASHSILLICMLMVFIFGTLYTSKHESCHACNLHNFKNMQFEWQRKCFFSVDIMAIIEKTNKKKFTLLRSCRTRK